MNTYRFHFTADVGKIIPSVGQVVDEVNRHMRDFGFHETMTLRNRAIACDLSGCRLLTPIEQRGAATIIEKGLREKLPQYDFQLDSIEHIKGEST